MGGKFIDDDGFDGFDGLWYVELED